MSATSEHDNSVWGAGLAIVRWGIASARRDIDVPRELMQHFGHNFMGVYAEVLEGGELAVGDTLLAEPALSV